MLFKVYSLIKGYWAPWESCSYHARVGVYKKSGVLIQTPKCLCSAAGVALKRSDRRDSAESRSNIDLKWGSYSATRTPTKRAPNLQKQPCVNQGKAHGSGLSDVTEIPKRLPHHHFDSRVTVGPAHSNSAISRSILWLCFAEISPARLG